jgi:hypothetical protein
MVNPTIKTWFASNAVLTARLYSLGACTATAAGFDVVEPNQLVISTVYDPADDVFAVLIVNFDVV